VNWARFPDSRQRCPKARSRAASLTILFSLLSVALGLSACGHTSSAAPIAPTGTLTITTHKTVDGTVLALGTGPSLYIFAIDTRYKASKCPHGACTALWPPVLEPHKLILAGGVRRSLIGTIKRPSGALQLTYAGWPLYTFTPSLKPGGVGGQALYQFGGFWYLIHTSGSFDTSPEQ